MECLFESIYTRNVDYLAKSMLKFGLSNNDFLIWLLMKPRVQYYLSKVVQFYEPKHTTHEFDNVL